MARKSISIPKKDINSLVDKKIEIFTSSQFWRSCRYVLDRPCRSNTWFTWGETIDRDVPIVADASKFGRDDKRNFPYTIRQVRAMWMIQRTEDVFPIIENIDIDVLASEIVESGIKTVSSMVPEYDLDFDPHEIEDVTEAVKNSIEYHRLPIYHQKTITKELKRLPATYKIIMLNDKYPFALCFDNTIVFFIFGFLFELVDHFSLFLQDRELEDDNVPEMLESRDFFPELFKTFEVNRTNKNIEDTKKYKDIKKNDITIGLDPEFLLYPKNPDNTIELHNCYEASNFLYGHEPVGIENHRLGELRPDAHGDTNIVTNNVKELLKTLNRRILANKRPLAVLAGGGYNDNIGGHIHFGNAIFKKLSRDEAMKLVAVLDDFLYFPMKIKMPGALRKWQDLDSICKVRNKSMPAEKIITAIKKEKIDPTQRLSPYEDVPHDKIRDQKWGIEWRSLPSFIADEKITALVLKLAQEIAYDYLKKIGTGGKFTYENPPQKKDYLKYLSKDEVNELFEYFGGKKKDVFLRDIIQNWEIIAEKYISIYADNTSHLGDNFLEKVSTIATEKYKQELEKWPLQTLNLNIIDLRRISDNTTKNRYKPIFAIYEKKIKTPLYGMIPEKLVSKYGGSYISNRLKENDITIITPQNFPRASSPYFVKNFLLDMLEIYFKKNGELFNQWNKFLKTWCIAKQISDAEDEKRQRKRAEAVKKEMRGLNSQENPSTRTRTFTDFITTDTNFITFDGRER